MFKRKILSDRELIGRLISTGLMRDKNKVNDEIMSVFAGIYAGLYVWDYKNSAVFKKDGLAPMRDAFDDLAKERDYHGMYLLLAVHYDQIMKPLPDPVWWLMCSPEAVEGFMIHFVRCFGDIYLDATSVDGESNRGS